MEILRIPPYNTQAVVDVSLPSTEYEYTVEDMVDHSITTATATSNAASKIAIPLPSGYDGEYLITVDGEETSVNVVRPYVNPNTVATNQTATDIANYTKYEEIARAIIDSIVAEGFYYRKKVLETTGNGADYLPLWVDAKKILKVYENNVLVYDSSDEASYAAKYIITKDNTAIALDYSGEINRLEGGVIRIPIAPSDMDLVKYSYKAFHNTFDYVVLLEVGHKRVPSDIARAAELLVDDIACGRLDYYNRYVSSYNTDQFKLSFDKRVFEGSGNIIVDKILSKYTKSIRSVGVL